MNEYPPQTYPYSAKVFSHNEVAENLNSYISDNYNGSCEETKHPEEVDS